MTVMEMIERFGVGCVFGAVLFGAILLHRINRR